MNRRTARTVTPDLAAPLRRSRRIGRSRAGRPARAPQVRGPGTTIEMIRDDAGLLRLEPDWAELAATVSARPFTRPYWCIPWWRYLGRGELSIVTARVDGRLIALAPLHVRRRGPIRTVRFLGHGVGTIGEALVVPGYENVATQLWGRVLSPRGVFLDLVNYADHGGGLDALRDLAGMRTRTELSDVCPFVAVEGAFDDYWAGRDHELHRVFRRSERALARRHVSWRPELITDAARVEQILPDLTRTFDAAERKNPRQHLLAPPAADFTKALLRESARADALRLFVGWIDDRVASFVIALRDDHQLALWVNRFDPAFADVAPGHRVLKAMVEHAFDQRCRRVDFLLGDFRYKRSWCTGAAVTLTVTGARKRPALIAGGATEAFLRQAHRHGLRVGSRSQTAPPSAPSRPS